MNSDRLTLVIDSNDTYLDQSDAFYFHPQRLALVRCLENEQFSSCLIKNSGVDCLSSLSLSYVLKKLKPSSVCEVVVYQPISVMQDYDAKQIEANAKLAGFTNFVTKDYEYKVNDKKVKTLLITFERPAKNGESEVDKGLKEMKKKK